MVAKSETKEIRTALYLKRVWQRFVPTI